MARPINKQVGKKTISLSPLKEQQKLSPFSFCFKRWMCDLQQKNQEWMIFITMAIVTTTVTQIWKTS
jgi:hypothetical protein